MARRARRNRAPQRGSRRRGRLRKGRERAGLALILLLIIGLIVWRAQHPPAGSPAPTTASRSIEPPAEPTVSPPPETLPPAPDGGDLAAQSAPPENWGLPSLIAQPELPDSTGETAAQSLLRLRDALSKGDFTELPIGTKVRDNSCYFYVSRPTRWHSANRMARAFGGHLAIVDSEEARLWLSQMVPPVTDGEANRRLAWIGASRTTPDEWHWVSSVRWQPDPPAEGSGDFAAIDQQGVVRARSATDEHPFFIEWNRDGDDPTAIRKLLAIAGQSLAEGHPIFPMGVEELDGRQLLVVHEECTYTEALELAEIAGAKLMTAASEEEADWLDQSMRKVRATNGFWLGATMTDHAWTWNDGQAWNFGRWAAASQAQSGDYLLARPDIGWDAEIRDYKAAGLVLEWSNETRASERFRPTLDQKDFTKRAWELLGEFQISRSKAAKANAETYIWQLNMWLRRRENNSEIQRWTPRIGRLKQAVKGGRMPTDIPRRPNGTYPPELHELAVFHLKKQVEIDQKFFTKAQSTRSAYVERLQREIAEAQQLGQREAALFFAEKIDEASDLKAWTKVLGF